MNCRKIRRWLPLTLRDDLDPQRQKKIESHLQKCPACREERDKFLAVDEKIRDWLVQDSIQWNPGEWEKVVRQAVSQPGRGAPALVRWPYKKGWAYALVLVISVLVGVFVSQPRPLKKFLGVKSSPTAVQEDYASGTEKDEKQDMICMTMVSRETGLKIVWIFDRNFDWEEIQ